MQQEVLTHPSEIGPPPSVPMPVPRVRRVRYEPPHVGYRRGPHLRPSQRWLVMLPLALVFMYSLWVWADYLNENVYSTDRYFHTLYFTLGGSKPTEPLWGIIAPLIGQVFPKYPFEAASAIVLVSVVAGMWRNRFGWLTVMILAFSPGVQYLLTNALRQGLAMGLFLCTVWLARRMSKRGVDAPATWQIVLLAGVPAVLIHNAMVIAIGYLVVSYLVLQHTARGWRSVSLQFALLGAAGVMALVVSEFGRVGGTAAWLLTAQAALLALCVVFRPLRHPMMPMVAVFILAVASGFMFTPTGLRVVILISMAAPLVLLKRGSQLAVAGCWVYPLATMALGFETENIVLDLAW